MSRLRMLARICLPKVLAYTIRMRSTMRIDRERTVVDLGSSASNYVADHLVGLGGEWQGAENPSFNLTEENNKSLW